MEESAEVNVETVEVGVNSRNSKTVQEPARKAGVPAAMIDE
jgi:hypothetical protein